MDHIGFVGLGNVGLPAALNLLKAGFQVVGYDIRGSAALAEVGGAVAETLADVARCPIILQSLPNTEALVATVDGLLPYLGEGQIVADLSSYPLEIKAAQACRVDRTGAVMLDCEISGLPFQVAQRTAVLFASGDRAAVETCAAVFQAFSDRHFYLGGFGAATKMKLIANYMVCAHNLIGAEALNLGASAGLEPAQMVEVLKPSAAGSTTFANKAELMLSRDFAAGSGPFRHMFGYLDRAVALARESGAECATPMLSRVREVYDVARREQRHDQDIAGIIEVVEAMNVLREVA